MAYLPPDRHTLTLRLSGGYTPPDRHALRLEIAPVRSVASTAQGQSVEAAGRFIATLASTVETAQGQSSDATGRVFPRRRYIGAQSALPWQPGVVTDRESGLAWANSIAIDQQIAVPISAGQRIDASIDFAWSATQSADLEAAVALSPGTPLHHSAALRWRNAEPRDQQRVVGWGQATAADSEAPHLVWRNPAAQDVERTLRWRVAEPMAHQTRLANGRAIPRDREARLPWRAALAVPWVYLLNQPPPPYVPPPVIPCYLPPPRHALRLRVGSGGLLYTPDRHALAFSLQCADPRRFDIRETLHMSHSLSVVRLPDRLPLAVRSVSLASDRDSWSWTVQLGFADAASLIAVEPTPTGLASVEITLDGHVFTAQVEGYTEDRSFAKRGGSVAARSRTVQLAAPNVPERPYTNPAPATAQQLALRELEFTDFSLDWQIDDWLVPAGAWSYERETPISALTKIATAAGAMLQSAPGADTLVVAARLPALPWLFEGATPDFTLAGGSWLRKGKRWNGGGGYNGVYIAGRDQGVLANVYRDGTSGSPYAQLVIDPLITAVEPARGRGGQILADSLPRHEIPIELPLTPAGSAPGLLMPGELGQIEDTVWGNYRAVVDSVQISAEVSADGLVTARQSASLWRYLP